VREMGAVAVIGLGARVSREEIGDDGWGCWLTFSLVVIWTGIFH
jgi:hypothetical protein